MKIQKFSMMLLLACAMTLMMSFTADNEMVKFVKTIHDFEQIPQGIPAKTTFKFTNHSDEPLILKSVKPSCGCTAPTFSKAPILPNESGEITVEYNAKNVGQFRKSVKVNTNLSETPMVLYIKGEVVK